MISRYFSYLNLHSRLPPLKMQNEKQRGRQGWRLELSNLFLSASLQIAASRMSLPLGGKKGGGRSLNPRGSYAESFSNNSVNNSFSSDFLIQSRVFRNFFDSLVYFIYLFIHLFIFFCFLFFFLFSKRCKSFVRDLATSLKFGKKKLYEPAMSARCWMTFNRTSNIVVR